MKSVLKRELDLDALVLQSGGHFPDSTFCVMEAVAFVAGEPWSDHPDCACPVVGAFLRSWNDNLNDTDRQRLKPYIPRLVGSKSTAAVAHRRSRMACDWLVRTFTAAWLRNAGLNEDAESLAALPELSAEEIAEAAMPAINKAKTNATAARDAARDAARAPAWDAAWDAALDAAWDAASAAGLVAASAAARTAARDAARNAAWAAARNAALEAAMDAAWAAAGNAALEAAMDAARAAAGAAIRATAVELQQSAFSLLDRMLEVSP